MGREFTIIIERDEEGFFVGTVPSLKGCHSQARSLDELMERMREAIQLCLDVEGETAAEPLQLIGVQKVAV
jgi:predicted RNase H-like HicB family nuclease